MLSFVILEKGLGIVSAAHFVYDFSTKIFPILLADQFHRLVAIEKLGKMCIAIVYNQVVTS